MHKCWEFSHEIILNEFEEVTGTSADTLSSSLPSDLQRCTASVCGIDYTISPPTNMQHVSGEVNDCVKYACKDVFIVDYCMLK